MIVTYNRKVGEPLTKEQLEELERAKNMPITFDDDCPELSPAMLKQLRCAVRNRNRLLNREKA